MIVHNEYLGWQIEWPENMQNTLCAVDDELWDRLLEFVHEKFLMIDTFHSDCVTFLWAFESKEQAREYEKEIKKRVCAWITAYC